MSERTLIAAIDGQPIGTLRDGRAAAPALTPDTTKPIRSRHARAAEHHDPICPPAHRRPAHRAADRHRRPPALHRRAARPVDARRARARRGVARAAPHRGIRRATRLCVRRSARRIRALATPRSTRSSRAARRRRSRARTVPRHSGRRVAARVTGTVVSRRAARARAAGRTRAHPRRTAERRPAKTLRVREICPARVRRPARHHGLARRVCAVECRFPVSRARADVLPELGPAALLALAATNDGYFAPKRLWFNADDPAATLAEAPLTSTSRATR